MALSQLAQKQLAEIQYAFGCGKDKAISYALESLHAFESISGDQVLNWMDDNYKEELQKWETDNADKRVKLENN